MFSSVVGVSLAGLIDGDGCRITSSIADILASTLALGFQTPSGGSSAMVDVGMVGSDMDYLVGGKSTTEALAVLLAFEAAAMTVFHSCV